jgi:O-antigen ligase
MTTLSARGVPRRNDLAIGLLGIAIAGIAFGTVHSPFLVTGAVVGAIVLLVALTAPLALVAVMLMIGPIDLSFATGGFKSLFPELGGLDMNGIRLLGATAGFFAYIMFEPRSRAAAVSRFGRMYIVFLVVAAATLPGSLEPLEGLRLLLKLAYPFLTFLIVVGLCDSRARAQALMRYTLVTAAFLTLVLNPIMVAGGGYRVDAGIVRVGGLGIGDNPFAFYCTIMLLIVFTRFMLRMQVRYLGFSAVLLIWIALTHTRIAALAAVVGLAVIGLLYAWSIGNRRVLIGAMIAAAVAGAVMLPSVMVRSFGFVPTPAKLFDLARNPMVLYGSINWQGRELLWAILWGAFMSSPLIGLGLGSSTAVIRETFPNQSVQVAHNEYMRLATDTGLAGVLLFATALIIWLGGMLRLIRRGDLAVREFAIPAAAGLVAWSLIAITDNAIDYYTNFTQYIGFLVGGAVVMRTYQDEPAGPRS